jgi:hypothetical protein
MDEQNAGYKRSPTWPEPCFFNPVAPATLWHEALHAATYLSNRSPHAALPLNQTPFFGFTGEQPFLSHLRAWGCKCYVINTRAQRKTKLQPKSSTAYLMGYRLYVPGLQRVVESPHVTFDETTFFPRTATHVTSTVLYDVHNTLATPDVQRPLPAIPAPQLQPQLDTIQHVMPEPQPQFHSPMTSSTIASDLPPSELSSVRR